MKLYFILIISFTLINIAGAQNINSVFVDLKGKKALTIIKNSSKDTLDIEGVTFYNLPYYETAVSLTIPPGKQDTIVSDLAYPDFIHLAAPDLQIWNAPGRMVTCEIRAGVSEGISISFSGDLVLENNYYSEYHTHFKGQHSETAAYYAAGERITDFNKLPMLADSILNTFLHFLENYNKKLPSYFKSYEESRLKYNNAFRKYNVLDSKAFKESRIFKVEPSYFSFESIPLAIDTIILSTEYLNYVKSYVANRTELRLFKKRSSSSPKKEVLGLSELMITLDSVLPVCLLRDAVKMNLMSLRYKVDKGEYGKVLQETPFFDTLNRFAVDSITARKNKMPAVGQYAPELIGIDVEGKAVSIRDFKGNAIILNFWAGWCLPCIKEFIYENALHDKYSSTDLVIVNICVETDVEKWKQLSRQHNLKMVNLFVTENQYKHIKNLYNLESLPRSVLVGKDQLVLDNYYKSASSITDKDLFSLFSPPAAKR